LPIIGLTDRGAAFPRIGTLRKGAAKPDGNRPGADLKDHFRFETDDEEARAAFVSAYGDKPNGIRIMFQFQTAAENFETWQEHHSAGALKHRCDGQVCVLTLLPDGAYSHEPVPCPSIELKRANPNIDKKHLCRPVGRLKIVIPELRRMAYVLAPTTSINDILELQANLEAAEAMRGDLRGIPFILSRRPRQVSTPGTNGQRARREKWLLSVEPSPEWVKLQLVAMERAALPMGAVPLALPPAGASYVDETTGEIFTADEEEEESLIEKFAAEAYVQDNPPVASLTTLTGACDLVKPWYAPDGGPRLAFVINSIRVVAAGDLAETWHDLENGETITVEGDYKEHPQKGQYLAAATIARVAQPVGADADLF
jgi:hypothetical protein